jgi:hypothetical protein
VSRAGQATCPRALVRSRFPVGPHVALYDNIGRYADVLKTLVSVLPALSAATAPQSSDGAMRKDVTRRRPARGEHMFGDTYWNDLPKRAPSRQSKPRGSFSELAEHLNRMEA